ncbi:hypothetical protein CH063_01327, partial [Colletotrichum higginsianum]
PSRTRAPRKHFYPFSKGHSVLRDCGYIHATYYITIITIIRAYRTSLIKLTYYLKLLISLYSSLIKLYSKLSVLRITLNTIAVL